MEVLFEQVYLNDLYAGRKNFRIRKREKEFDLIFGERGGVFIYVISSDCCGLESVFVITYLER